MNSKKYKQINGRALEGKFIEHINIKKLKAEMKLISSLTNLQLRDGSENSKKGQF